jgi:hypothetical protein
VIELKKIYKRDILELADGNRSEAFFLSISKHRLLCTLKNFKVKTILCCYCLVLNAELVGYMGVSFTDTVQNPLTEHKKIGWLPIWWVSQNKGSGIGREILNAQFRN